MKVSQVEIHNYRGILDGTFDFSSYTLLVGPNNAGKSTVVDAIRAFYEKDGFKYKHDTDFPFLPTSDSESWIEFTFALSDAEYNSLKDEYKVTHRRLNVRKFFETERKNHENKPCAGSIFAYKADGSLSNEPFYGAKNVQSGKFGDIIYIPAVSKVDEHTKLSGPSALRDLLSGIVGDVIAASPAYAQFSASVMQFSRDVRTEKTPDNRSVEGLENQLNEFLAPWQTSFHLTIPPPSATEIVKSMVAWDLIDEIHGKAQSIENYGSGFQRHFIYSLIHVSAQYQGRKVSKKTKDFTPTMSLVLFEEPEAFLHPPQQDILARNLRELSTPDGRQTICATHSPHFVSKQADDIPAIIRLTRSKAEIAKFQISKDAWSQIVDANQVISALASKYGKLAKSLTDDDKKPEMEALKHFLWLNSDRCRLFFADSVLLVEGPSETALIRRLLCDGLLGSSVEGVCVLDCLGKFNAHRFMNLLNAMGIRHSILHDDDGNTDYHAELNKLISDSAGSYTTTIKTIAGDLETFLGIGTSGAERRKPQHILYQYETGKIPKPNLTAFCGLVSDCVAPKTESDLS